MQSWSSSSFCGGLRRNGCLQRRVLLQECDGVPDVMCGDGGTLPADEAVLKEQVVCLVTLQVFNQQPQSL